MLYPPRSGHSQEDVTSRSPQERFEFEQSVDGLFRGALAAHEDPAVVEALREAGLDLTKKLQPAYKAEEFYRWVRLAARTRFPELDELEGCRRIGQLAVERGLSSTLLGRALLQFIKVVGVRRALLRLGSAFRHGNNYIEAKVTEVGPNTMEVELGPLVGPATYFAGVLENGPKQIDARETTVTEMKRDGEFVTFRVEWTE